MTRTGNRVALAASAAMVAFTLLAGLFLAVGCGTAQVGKHLVSPFTGERVGSLNRVLAVKIDNIAQARPQTGLDKADIVYVLPVEGGLSRILAIFSSHVPPVVGPVRSAREDDLELLRQFDRPAFAYSGATPVLLPYVRRAQTVDLYAGTTSGYFRSASRVAPYNLYAHTGQLLAQAGGASRAGDIGFRFGAAPAGGQPTSTERVSYPAASFAFTWSAAKGRWLISMDGTPAVTASHDQLSAATVVIQHTIVRTSRFLEYGSRPPYAQSTGSGTAVVLRNGKAYQARWSRPAADGGTSFTTADGQPMTFAPGPVWVILTSR
ncbi:MAG TPA: DUF3048 domain-containing protein [Streptosporangiaceae bacterium]|nr:DUF3048 domain-containing protein [Streptosporangiaceae bacterium]